MQTVAEKIRQRRRQILVHSFLYYELDSNIIDDSTWSKWAVELAELQRKNSKEAAQVEYADLFRDFDGSTGAFLKYDGNIKSMAHRLYCKHWGLKMQTAKSENKKTEIAEKSQKGEIKSLNKQLNKKGSTRSLF